MWKTKTFSCGYALDSLDLSRKVMGLLPKNGGGVSVSAQEVCLQGIRSKHLLMLTSKK